MFIVNYLQSLLAEILIISIEKTFAGIFLDRIGLATVMTQTFCGLTGKLNFRPLCHAPIKTKRVGSGKVPWITSDLRKGIRDRDLAKRKAIKSNNPLDWAMYKRLRNSINGEVKSTKASYYASAFVQSNGDSRKTWQLINELTSHQKNNASVKELY